MKDILNLSLNSPSNKNIYEKLLYIANKYNDTNDIEYLRKGLFGYITESMALSIRDTILQKSMLYNEYFLNTAVLPSTIYNWAKTFNVDINKATPSSVDMTITIDKEKLENYINNELDESTKDKYGIDDSPAYKGIKSGLILDKNNEFIANNFYFTMISSVIIYKKNGSDNYNRYAASYLLQEFNKSFNNMISNPYINVIDEGNSISLNIKTVQVQKNRENKFINNSSFLNSKIHEFNFEDQLALVRLFYKKNNEVQPVNLKFSNIESDEEQTAYYSLIDDKTLQIKFSNAFIPAINSEIILDIYTTKGSAGNISFINDVSFQLKEEELRSLPIKATFATISSKGGVDTPSLNKIKEKIITELSTRNTIITESDLNLYLNNITSLINTINGGNIEFKKKRDDILKRLFSAELLLRTGFDAFGNPISSDRDSTVIPTNTIDAVFSISNNTSKPFGTLIVKNKDTGEYVESETNILDKDVDNYVVPFYMYNQLKPIKDVKYIYNLTNTLSGAHFIDNIDIAKGNCQVIDIRAKRGLSNSYSADNKIIITSTFVIDSDFRNMIDNATDIRGTYKIGNSVKKDVIFSDITFKETSESEGFYYMTIAFSLEIAEDEFGFKDSSNCGSFLKLKNGVSINPEDYVEISLSFNYNIKDEKEKLTANSLKIKSADKLRFFKPLDNIMTSTIQVNKDIDGNISSIRIKDIPVVHISYFLNNTIESNEPEGMNLPENAIDIFTTQLFNYIDVLDSNIEKLETNTFFDLKFKNTRGESKMYKQINNTGLKLELDIHLFDSINKTKELENEIKEVVRLLVESQNETGQFRVSKLINDILTIYGEESQIPYIERIDFLGLNGTFNQNISKDPNVIASQEYFNIPVENLKYINII